VVSRAVPGIAPCSIHGPQSASLIPHFGFLPPPAVERIGGRLKNFSPFWRDVLGCTQYALTSTSPRLLPCRARISAPPLRARTIVSSTKRSRPSFSRCLPLLHLYATSVPFFSSQKSGGMHPILNLKKLNLCAPRYPILPHGDYRGCPPCPQARRLGGIYRPELMRDAYFHVPLHHSTKKYMCFRWRGRLFRFCVLPFGLSPAQKVFTALTRLIKVHFRSGRRTVV
jgi:hypothetical protein